MNIPQRWLDVLSALQSAGFTEAFIGGGALRDLDHGKPVKDVDIFVRYCGAETFEKVKKILGNGGEDRTQYHSEYVINFPDVAGVYEFWSEFDEPPLNVISCNGPDGDYAFREHHLARFDLGICRITHDGKYVAVDPAYQTDKANQTITIVNPVKLERSIERAKRIRGRAYCDWAVILPDGSSMRIDTFSFDVV